MGGDPYARIVAVIRGETKDQTPTSESNPAGLGANPCKMRLGKVKQRIPLKITVAGIEQPTEVLYINERLVRGAKWKVQITSPDSDYKGLTGYLSGPVECQGEGCAPQLGKVTAAALHSPDTTIGKDTETGMATTEQLEIDLEVNDQVLLLTEDDQTFYIIMKVVPAV